MSQSRFVRVKRALGGFVGSPRAGGGGWWLGGQRGPKLDEIVGWWACGRSLVAMGRTSRCGMAAASLWATIWGSARAASRRPWRPRRSSPRPRIRHVTMAQRTSRAAMTADSRQRRRSLRRWCRPSRPPWSMGAATPGQHHATHPGTTRDGGLSALRPSPVDLAEVRPHLATCHHSPRRR